MVLGFKNDSKNYNQRWFLQTGKASGRDSGLKENKFRTILKRNASIRCIKDYRRHTIRRTSWLFRKVANYEA